MSNHIPVLLAESINGLNINPDGIYIDATFGRGGHSKVILQHLSHHGRLIAIDKDPEAVAHAKVHFEHDSRFHIVHGSNAHLLEITKHLDLVGKIDGILVDLGVSSPQLDEAHRGFSFMKDGPLDMRMDTTQGITAAQFVNEASVETLTEVFREYGEERFAGRIARAIVNHRIEHPFMTTKELAEVVSAANPRWEKHKHPATRVFQAIRIHINRELEDLKQLLQEGLAVLNVGGRLAVISFHSLEDRVVKHFFKDQSSGDKYPKGLPIRAHEIKACFKCIGKAIKASISEVEGNIRARSAVLRIGEKIA